jgi:hypothetical protein
MRRDEVHAKNANVLRSRSVIPIGLMGSPRAGLPTLGGFEAAVF